MSSCKGQEIMNCSTNHIQEGEPGRPRVSWPRYHLNINSMLTKPVLLMVFLTSEIRNSVTGL